jgi:hypothetical protein
MKTSGKPKENTRKTTEITGRTKENPQKIHQTPLKNI